MGEGRGQRSHEGTDGMRRFEGGMRSVLWQEESQTGVRRPGFTLLSTVPVSPSVNSWAFLTSGMCRVN